MKRTNRLAGSKRQQAARTPYAGATFGRAPRLRPARLLPAHTPPRTGGNLKNADRHNHGVMRSFGGFKTVGFENSAVVDAELRAAGEDTVVPLQFGCQHAGSVEPGAIP